MLHRTCYTHHHHLADKLGKFFYFPEACDLAYKLFMEHSKMGNQELGCTHLKYQETKGARKDTISVSLYPKNKALFTYEDQHSQAKVKLEFSTTQINVLTFHGTQGLFMLEQAGYKTSRLCKDPECFKPEHLVVEPFKILKEREFCRAGTSCVHWPKCIKAGTRQGRVHANYEVGDAASFIPTGQSVPALFICRATVRAPATQQGQHI